MLTNFYVTLVSGVDRVSLKGVNFKARPARKHNAERKSNRSVNNQQDHQSENEVPETSSRELPKTSRSASRAFTDGILISNGSSTKPLADVVNECVSTISLLESKIDNLVDENRTLRSTCKKQNDRIDLQ